MHEIDERELEADLLSRTLKMDLNPAEDLSETREKAGRISRALATL